LKYADRKRHIYYTNARARLWIKKKRVEKMIPGLTPDSRDK